LAWLASLLERQRAQEATQSNAIYCAMRVGCSVLYLDTGAL